MGMIKEFKEFALRGNMVDMAVGIVMGGAFGGVVTSLVKDVIMPVAGALTGGANFDNNFLWLGEGEAPATLEAAKQGLADGTLNGAYLGWGAFLTVLINFFFLALAIFVLVKVMNALKRKEEEAPAEPPKQEVLLGEIRDLLAKNA